MLLSTLSSFVHAMGGELELICRFKKRPPIRIMPPAAVTPRDGVASKTAKKGGEQPSFTPRASAPSPRAATARGAGRRATPPAALPVP